MDAERSLAELYRSSFTSNATLLLLIPYASLYEVGFDGSEQTLGQAPLRIVQLPLPNLAPQAAPAAEGAGKPWYAFAPASGSKGKATVKKYDRISSMDVIGAEEELSSAAPNVLTYLFVGSFGAIPLVPDLQPLRVSPRVYIFPMDDDTASSANPVTWGAENPSGRMLFRVEFPASVGGPFLLAFERLLARLTVYTSPWVR
ncbi:hypothetical protein BJ742DRAFT_100225 [Cladochytrium replicatum]|nr:hypothetical protein BJ742DRAFT_100225 [Cladochytrium replicatum]